MTTDIYTHMRNTTLFLTLETFSQTGGIQKVCRSLAVALQEITGALTLLSLCDGTQDLMERYVNKDRFEGFRGGKVVFTSKAIRAGFKHRTIVLAHVNLLPIAYFIKLCSPSRRIILLAHGVEVWKQLSKVQRRFLNKHTEIWAVSEFTKEKLVKVNQISANKITVLHNCLDPFFRVPESKCKPSALLERYEIDSTQPVLLTICRLSAFEHRKGYDLVIRCIPQLLVQHPTLKYVIVGPCDNQEKERLEQLITKLNIKKHVSLAGFIPEIELANHFQLADVFIMVSKKEGFGLVLIEAAASGCSVIAGNRDGSTEALLGGKLGTIVDPETPEEIFQAIQSALRSSCTASTLENQTMALNSFSFSNYKHNVRTLLT
jgi:phosphatidylinositol alpha-1,6-mannosyltransferase